MSCRKSEEQIKTATTKNHSVKDYQSRSTDNISEPKKDIHSSPPIDSDKEENNTKKRRRSFRELFKIKSNHSTACPENEQLMECPSVSLNNEDKAAIDKVSNSQVKLASHNNQENSKNIFIPQNLDEGTMGMLSSDLKTLCVDDVSSNLDAISEMENSLEPSHSGSLNNIDTNKNVSYYKQLGQHFEHIILKLYGKEQINNVNGDQAMLDFMRNICSLKSQNEKLMSQNESYKTTLSHLKQELSYNDMKKKRELKQCQKIHQNKINIIEQHERTNKTLQEEIEKLENTIRTRTNVQMFYFEKSIEFYSTVREIFACIIDKKSMENFNICLNNLIENMSDFNDVKTTSIESIKLIITNFFNNEFIKIFLADYRKTRHLDQLIEKLALLESENTILQTKIQKQKKILKMIENNMGLPSLQNELDQTLRNQRQSLFDRD